MKRGASGLSLLVGVKKPLGMSSHDVVNRCRKIFGEKRVGHTGTLDPLAEGVLPICIGPATRLDAYMVGHDKEYRVSIRFGYETGTDDAEGEPTAVAPVPAHLDDLDFAQAFVGSLIGFHDQVPPQYSAIKIDGQTAYKLARKGQEADLEPRRIQILDAQIEDVTRDEEGYLIWDARLCVSKGTYIRSIARDVGRELGSAAHVARLERIRAGRIYLEQCVSLEALELLKENAALDPVRVLGVRYAFADDFAQRVASGASIDVDMATLYEALDPMESEALCTCSSSVAKSEQPPKDGELIAFVVGNRLKALYAYAANRCEYKPACVFSVPVFRF